MSTLTSSNCNEIEVVDDEMDDFDVIKRIIEIRDQEDAFYVLDIGNVIAKHKAWLSKMPRVEPHFAIKCNPDPTVIKILAALGASFDCASKNEIEQVMAFGVQSQKIIFANPVKPHSHIKFAKKVGVDKLTVDGKEELLKIRDLFPEAKIMIRFRCDAMISETELGSKFGCDPEGDAPGLIRRTKELGLDLYGFSFHVGSQCGEATAYSRGINICKNLIQIVNSMGCKGIKMIDIGGGFPGETRFTIDEFAEDINRSLEALDPSIRVISEPGRYYVASAFTSATFLHSKKSMIEDDKKKYVYYVNDGVYGSFIEELLNIKARTPVSLNGPISDDTYSTIIWGPTCDSYDCIVKDVLLPKFNVGDWLIWKDMGAYTRSLASTFNGYFPPIVYPFIRKSAWERVCNKTLGFVQQNGIHNEKSIPIVDCVQSNEGPTSCVMNNMSRNGSSQNSEWRIQ